MEEIVKIHQLAQTLSLEVVYGNEGSLDREITTSDISHNRRITIKRSSGIILSANVISLLPNNCKRLCE